MSVPFISPKNIARIMILAGLVAFFMVVFQACQPTASHDIHQFRKASLKRLTVLDAPPPLSALTFKTADGLEMQLTDYKGQVIVLNVWATWCAPCVEEMPSLDRLAGHYSGQNLAVVTVSLDSEASDAADFLKAHNIDNLVPWHDDSLSLGTKLGTPGLPLTVIYDQSAQERARLVGSAHWDSREAAALIDFVLAGGRQP